ncbi:MAG: hypothetical protein AABW92_04940 [Nanoarchaeota archaeon]
MKKVNIALKDEVHSQAKIISILKDIPMGQYLDELISEAIKKDLSLIEKLSKEQKK